MSVRVEIHNKNILDFFREENPQNKYHFAFYDPPYELGILEYEWDKNGLIYSKEYNSALYNAMLPGAYVLCFGHGKTFHRVACALEDSGFIIHKAIFGWGYRKGMPQGAAPVSRNLDNYFAKRYDGYCSCENKNDFSTKEEGSYTKNFSQQSLEVKFCNNCNKPIRDILNVIKWHKDGGKKGIGGRGMGNNNEQLITAPLTYESKIFGTYVYGHAALRPAIEPIIVAQKPFIDENNPVETIALYGTGVVNTKNKTLMPHGNWPSNFVAVDSDKNLSDKFKETYATFDVEDVETMVFCDKPSKAEKEGGIDKSRPHPTLKPIALNKYLTSLFLPPEEYNPSILIPFSGSGSEVIGAIQAGWKNLTCIEINPEHVNTAEKRIKHYTGAEVLIA